MKCAVAILLVIAVAGCKKDPTLVAFERAAAELPAAELGAREVGLIEDQLSSPEVPDNGITMKSQVVNAVVALRSKLSDRNAFDLNAGKYVTSEDDSQISDIAAAFDRVEADLDRIRAAASLKPSGFVGSDLVFNKDIHSFKDGIKYLCLRSTLLSRRGQPSKAIEDVSAAVALCHAPLESTDMIGQYYAASFQAMVIRALEWNLTECPKRLLPRLLQVTTQLRNPIAVEAALRDQALRELKHTSQSELAAFRQSDPTSSQEVRTITPPNVPIPLLARAYRARNLQYWSRVLVLARTVTDLRHLAHELEAHRKVARTEKDPTYALVKFFDAGLTGLVDSFQIQEAKIRVCRAVGLALDHRCKTGKWPLSVPGNPTDPFDGKPLRFKFARDTAVIYSIGSDLIDNDGDRKKDIVFCYPATK